MTLKYPGESVLAGLTRTSERDAARRAVLHLRPRAVYGGLLCHAREQGWKDGWAWHAFKELYGTPPRRQDQGPPSPPSTALKTWIAMRPRSRR
jgi:hypothetical protein